MKLTSRSRLADLFRIVCFLFIFSILFAPLSAAAAVRSVEHVVIVLSRDLAPYQKAAEVIEGKVKGDFPGVRVDRYIRAGKEDKDQKTLKKIKEKNPEFIFTVGTEAFGFVDKAMQKRSIIMSMVYDPEHEKSFQPTGNNNVYGAVLKVPYEKRFELIRKLFPQWKKVGLAVNSNNKAGQYGEIKNAAQTQRFAVVEERVQGSTDFMGALKKLSMKSDAFLMTLDTSIYNAAIIKEMLLFSARKKYPIIAVSPNYVKSGALVSFSYSYKANGERAAELAKDLYQEHPVVDRFFSPTNPQVSINRSVMKTYQVSLSKVHQELVYEYL